MIFLDNKKPKIKFGVIHFVGIGGIGMSGIAEIMHNLGYKIQGSDITINTNTERLEKLGIKILIGHSEHNILNAEIIVISSAIKPDNPEIESAVNLQIPIISRAEMLAELIRFKTGIAISGAHGKTTTVSLTACMFEAAGIYPSVINGGIINNKSTNAYLGSSDYLIAEADESDASFIKLPATIAVITNIDKEHLDFYSSFENIILAFRNFITNLPFYGFAVACIDHPTVRQLVGSITNRKIITYGIDSADAHIQAFNIVTDIYSSVFDIKINLPGNNGQITIEKINLPIPGVHNILNSLASIAIASELDLGFKVIKEGFKHFKGVKRRFTTTGKYNGITIIDDYAHHPSEIVETLKTAKYIATKQGGKLITIFQPHRYSRLKILLTEFANSFNLTEQLYITDVYSAGEQVIDNLSHHSLVELILKNNSNIMVKALNSHEEIPNIIYSSAKPNDLVLMLGAGNITQWASVLPEQLKQLSIK